MQSNGLQTPLPIPNALWIDILWILCLVCLVLNRGEIIFVVVDRFSKITHFIPCNKTNDATNVVDLFFREIVHFHSMARTIMLNRDVKFLSYFWKTLWRKLGTK